jgi:tRNA C32,U32 (ribose-2'-O)-methylase TrmJ
MDKVSDDDLKKFVTSDPPWNTMRTARMAQEIITSRERIDQLEKALQDLRVLVERAHSKSAIMEQILKEIDEALEEK